MSIYSPKALLTKQPVVIASTIRQALLVAVLMGAIALDEKQLAGIAIFVELGLSLFTWSSVVPAERVRSGEVELEPEPEPTFDPVLGDAP